MKSLVYIYLCICFALVSKARAQQKVQFQSLDSLTITADLYEAQYPKGLIILCHQSKFSRGEYREIAPRLVNEGFTCLAIDQRAGNSAKGLVNETAELARKLGKPGKFMDAYQDMKAAVIYAKQRKLPIILWGSSYSSGLALLENLNNPEIVASLSFSPGNYYGDHPKIDSAICALHKPYFLTGSANECIKLVEWTACADPKYYYLFIPKNKGDHGSKVLWKNGIDRDRYWSATLDFLNSLHLKQ